MSNAYLKSFKRGEERKVNFFSGVGDFMLIHDRDQNAQKSNNYCKSSVFALFYNNSFLVKNSNFG